jgi:hypothetical protein
MVADICSSAVHPTRPVGVWEEEIQKHNNGGVAAVTGQAFNSLNNTVTSDWPVCSWEAWQLAPTIVSQMTIGQAYLMQKLITIMELKV